MELRHLRYFIAVAEELHFGRAAQRLGISQPPLSQQIKALETSVGVRLLNRSKHKVTLTAAGAAALIEAYRLIEQADHLRAIARQANAGVVHRLAIGCVSSALFDVLPPILKRLHAQHPEIGLSVQDQETNEAVPSMLEEKLDLAFVRIEKVAAPLAARLIMRDHFITALPSLHPLARRKTIPTASLVDEPLIVYTRRSDPRTHDRIIAGCLKEGFRPNVVYQSPSIQSQIGMVACGLGIAIVPKLVRRWRIPGVVYRPLETPIEAASVYVVWNRRRLSQAVQLLLEVTEQIFP